MKTSTKNIFKMHGWRVDHAIHNYIYFKYYDIYTSLYLRAGRFLASRFLWLKVLRCAFKFVFDRYHAKVLTGSDVRKIITLQEDLIIGPDKSTRIIPFLYANKVILKEPKFIAVMDCPCRLNRGNGCQPVNVCIAVGRTTAEFWLEHCEKYNVRKITQEEATEIIMGARGRGCITMAWFKLETGGRTGVICSCCPCCCGGIEGMRIGRKFDKDLTNIAPSGYAVEWDRNMCTVCGKCATICPFGAVTVFESGDRHYDQAACMGCGLCTEMCEQHDLDLVRDVTKGYPLELDFVIETLGRGGA